MATVLNKADYALSINPKGVSERYFCPPGGVVEIPDALAREWSSRAQRQMSLGHVIVRGPEQLSEKPETVLEPSEDLLAMRWNIAVQAVAELDWTLDDLEAAHAREHRPKVRQAIEARMVALRGS